MDGNCKHWLKMADSKSGTVARLLYPRCMCHGYGECNGKLEFHHLIGRGVKSFRHDPRNFAILCTEHHTQSNKLSPHKAPKAFDEWMEFHLPSQWAWVKANQWKAVDFNYHKAFDRLEGIEEMLKSGMKSSLIVNAMFAKGVK